MFHAGWNIERDEPALEQRVERICRPGIAVLEQELWSIMCLNP